MPTTVELISPTDTITFAASPDLAAGWVYDNDTLDAWYAFPGADSKIAKRPNSHGAFGLGQIYAKEARPIVSGQYYGETPAAALVARERLSALFADGRPVTMRVTDDLRVTTRVVWLLEASTVFRYDFAHFPFDLSLVAPDPRRYGAQISDSDGMPTAGGGLFWNLGAAPSTLFFDWGAEGVAGQVTFENTGNAASFPRIEVGGAGSFAAGFRITEIETGRELTFERDSNFGEVFVFDSRAQRATLAAGDVTAFLSSRDWFTVPAGATRRYQITPLGSVADAPTMTIYASPAYL